MCVWVVWGRGSSTFTLAPASGEFKCPDHPRGGGVRGLKMTGASLERSELLKNVRTAFLMKVG